MKKKGGTVGGQKGVGEHGGAWTSGGKRTPGGGARPPVNRIQGSAE